MFRKHCTRALALLALAAGGVTAAMLIAPGRAQAYTTSDLISLGYNVGYSRLADGCHHWKAAVPHADWTDLGSDCDPNFQTNLDAYIADTYCYVKPTAPACIPTVTETTTSVQTETQTETFTIPTLTVETAPAPPAVTVPPVTTTVEQYVREQLPPPPIAGFTVSIDHETATVTDTSGAAEACWQFGDGSDDCGASESHTYDAPGRYVIVETVVSSIGLASETAQGVTVLPDAQPLPAGADGSTIAPR